MSDWITNLGTGLVVAIVTSFVTVRLSLKSFVSQRWWERKAEAYSQSMEQLSYCEHYESTYLDKIERGAPTDSDWLEERGKEAGEASLALRRVAGVGAFTISENAAKALRDRLKPDPTVRQADLHEVLDDNLYRIRVCMKVIREEAERDLNPGLFGRWR